MNQYTYVHQLTIVNFKVSSRLEFRQLATSGAAPCAEDVGGSSWIFSVTGWSQSWKFRRFLWWRMVNHGDFHGWWWWIESIELTMVYPSVWFFSWRFSWWVCDEWWFSCWWFSWRWMELPSSSQPLLGNRWIKCRFLAGNASELATGHFPAMFEDTRYVKLIPEKYSTNIPLNLRMMVTIISPFSSMISKISSIVSSFSSRNSPITSVFYCPEVSPRSLRHRSSEPTAQFPRRRVLDV